jgi:uncharacterized protein (TIGR02466 family)
MEILSLFPDYLLVDHASDQELSDIREELWLKKTEISKLITQGTWGDNISTTVDLCKNVIKQFNLIKLESFIEPRIHAYLKTYTLYKDVSKISLFESWVNFSNRYSFQNLHIHPPWHSTVSGVFFVEVPENCGNTVFVPGLVEEDLKGSYEVKPEPGKLLIFHGSLPHMVRVNNSTSSRISISFNYSLKIDRFYNYEFDNVV